MAAIVVGDIDRGGVFAHLHVTVDLLPADLRPLVQGFVINRFRGDPALLGDGMEMLRRRCGVPTLGVVPMLRDRWFDGEDSLALDVPYPSAGPPIGDPLDVVVVLLPQISNYTDVDALAIEPGVSVRTSPRLTRSAAQTWSRSPVRRRRSPARVGSRSTAASRGQSPRTAASAAPPITGCSRRWLPDAVPHRPRRSPRASIRGRRSELRCGPPVAFRPDCRRHRGASRSGRIEPADRARTADVMGNHLRFV